jgi:hypothetical protein
MPSGYRGVGRCARVATLQRGAGCAFPAHSLFSLVTREAGCRRTRVFPHPTSPGHAGLEKPAEAVSVDTESTPPRRGTYDFPLPRMLLRCSGLCLDFYQLISQLANFLFLNTPRFAQACSRVPGITLSPGDVHPIFFSLRSPVRPGSWRRNKVGRVTAASSRRPSPCCITPVTTHSLLIRICFILWLSKFVCVNPYIGSCVYCI